MSKILHQTGVLPYRVRKGKLQVMLLTSRDQGRWIIPKGNIGSGSTPLEAALNEAYEEAGLEGSAGSLPFGIYTYFKRQSLKKPCPATVEVYLMRVDRQLDTWPEKGQRQLAWMSIKKALRMVQEPGIEPLLDRLAELEPLLIADSAEAPAVLML